THGPRPRWRTWTVTACASSPSSGTRPATGCRTASMATPWPGAAGPCPSSPSRPRAAGRSKRGLSPPPPWDTRRVSRSVARPGEVELLAATRAGRKEGVALRCRKRGQGMVLYQGYTPPDLTLGVADVDGDGAVEVLYCGEAKDGSATLAAARPDGRVLWEHAF